MNGVVANGLRPLNPETGKRELDMSKREREALKKIAGLRGSTGGAEAMVREMQHWARTALAATIPKEGPTNVIAEVILRIVDDEQSYVPSDGRGLEELRMQLREVAFALIQGTTPEEILRAVGRKEEL
jgi:hypothetical protein